ncbi:hypothetical protein KKF32_00260 [Patescibacteria group bacterium]|nr:hypothetical protein [Patescibacteria group bacterium]
MTQSDSTQALPAPDGTGKTRKARQKIINMLAKTICDKLLTGGTGSDVLHFIEKILEYVKSFPPPLLPSLSAWEQQETQKGPTSSPKYFYIIMVTNGFAEKDIKMFVRLVRLHTTLLMKKRATLGT